MRRTSGEIEERIRKICSVINKETSLEQFDSAVSEFKEWLGDQKETGIFEGLEELREAVVQNLEAGSRRVMAKNELIRLEIDLGMQAKFDA